MKKSRLLMALLLLLTWTLAACGAEAPAADQTAALPPETTAAAVQTTQPAEIPEVIISHKEFYLPLPETMSGAVFAEGYVDDSNYINVAYDDAGPEAMEEFLRLCAASGLYGRQIQVPEGESGYALHALGDPFMGITYLDPDTDRLMVLTEYTENFLYPDQLETHLAYYRQEPAFPPEFGKTVLPQFWSVIGADPSPAQEGANVDYVFGGDSFLSEAYTDVSPDALRKYMDEMILCGFDPWVVTGMVNDAGIMETTILQLSNQDAQVVVAYDSGDSSVFVYYESDAQLKLLTPEEYAEYIPQS